MLTVVAALIEREGLLLLAQRNRGRHRGLWELPGGKIERDESPREALARELDEELGVRLTRAEPVNFAYQDDEQPAILLLLYRCEVTGAIAPAENQAIAWLDLRAALARDLPPLDRELLTRLA